MKKNRVLYIAIPILFILAGLVFYEYGYLRIKTEEAVIREEQESKAKTLEKYLSVIAERPDLEKRLAALKEQRKSENAKMVEGETFSLAAAALQDMVKSIIVSRNGVISSERMGKEEEFTPGPPDPPRDGLPKQKGERTSLPGKEKKEEKKRFRIVQVSFDFTAPDIGVLRDIVFFIETKTPYLVIKELDARVRNFRDPRELMVRLDVTALYGGR
ncbi:MAG: hypothetical protein AB1585_22115 [Thermodesulfobacteriota bacterium]